MADRYKYLTIWVTETNSVFKSVPEIEVFFVNNVTWNNNLKAGDFFRDVLRILGNDGWQIVSSSVPDENGITRFILSKKV